MAKYRVVPVPVLVEVWRPRRGYCPVQGYTIEIDGVETVPFMPRARAYETLRLWREQDRKEK